MAPRTAETTAKKAARPTAARRVRASATGGSTGDGGKVTKLAERVARDIEQRIVKAKWPVGESLGSEPSLLEEYQVSRAVLREAIRLLEHDHIATMRRGPGQGLVVTAPDPGAVVRSVALELNFQGVTVEQLFDARLAIELRALELATANLDETGVERLRAALEAEQTYVDHVDQAVHDLHVVIADLAGNPAMRLFVEILTRLSHAPADIALVVSPEQLSASPMPTEVSELHRAHEAIVDAMIAGDSALSQHRMLRHLEAMKRWMEQQSAQR